MKKKNLKQNVILEQIVRLRLPNQVERLVSQRKYFVEMILQMLKNDEWEITEFKLIHKETGVSIWIANGFWFISLYAPVEIHFGAIGKIRIWLQYLKYIFRNRKQVKQMKQKLETEKYKSFFDALVDAG